MPLSDREEQLLKEMEGALKTTRAPSARRGKLGIVVVALGFILLIAGAVIPIVAVGVLGYIVMLGGLMLYLESPNADSMRGRMNNRIQRSAHERSEMRRKKS